MITQYRPSYYQSPRAPSFAGRSIDDKPLNVENGSTFKEIDTGRVYRYDEENNIWIEQEGATPVQPAKPEQAKTVDLAMATGNQTITPDEGKTLSSVTVSKPATMIPANIKTGVNIGGVVGTAPTPKAEQTKTVALSMLTGDQTVVPDSGKVMTSVTVTKPDTLVAGNIKNGVAIGGVIGTLTPAKSEQTKTVDLSMASGNQTVSADASKVMTAVTITKPETLVAGNIKTGVAIGGITGTLSPAKAEEIKTVDLAMASGDQIITPTSGKVMTSVKVTKPATMTPANIKKGVTIGGVVGTYDNTPTTPYVMETYADGALTGATLYGYTTVRSNMFYNCTALASVAFKSTPTTIAADAFTGCDALTAISVPWAEGAVAGAPWGATNATITYNYTA